MLGSVRGFQVPLSPLAILVGLTLVSLCTNAAATEPTSQAIAPASGSDGTGSRGMAVV